MGYGEKKFNLLGGSMGGHIAGVYAAKHGNMLKSVTLVSSSGINAPVHTRYFDAVDDDILLLPRTEDEVQDLIKDTSYQYDPMAQEALHGIIQDMKQRRPVLKKGEKL